MTEKSSHGKNKLKTCLIFFSLMVLVGCSPDAHKMAEELHTYGNKVAASFDTKIKYESLVKTLEKPRLSYVLKFSTDAAELMSSPGAGIDKEKFRQNLARTEVWQAKVCTEEIRKLIAEHNAFLVSFNLTNNAGETQAMGVCSAI